MFTVAVNDEMLAKLGKIASEEGREYCVRLREYRQRSGCCSCNIFIGLGLDTFNEDEDEKIDVRGVPFIAEKSFLLKYGKTYELEMGEDRQVVVKAPEF